MRIIERIKGAVERRDARFLTAETKNERRFSGDDEVWLKPLLSKLFGRKLRPAEPLTDAADTIGEALTKVAPKIDAAVIVAGSITSDKIAQGSITIADAPRE